MYEKAIALNVKDFIGYLDAIAALDSSLEPRPAQAKELLAEQLEKAQGGGFSKEDARYFQGMLTKGIGDWAWPLVFAGEIDRRIANLCALAYAEEISHN